MARRVDYDERQYAVYSSGPRSPASTPRRACSRWPSASTRIAACATWPGRRSGCPLPDASCAAALVSNVLHHVTDRPACAAELRRVLRPGGLLLLRLTPRADLAEGIPFFDHFPTALAVDGARVPSEEEIAALFATGWEQVAHARIEQEAAPSFRDYTDRIATRAVSTLELIDDAEFEQGIARMREVAEREDTPAPVMERVHLVVLRRVPSG